MDYRYGYSIVAVHAIATSATRERERTSKERGMNVVKWHIPNELEHA
jgi:hypothetical protein